MPNLLKTDLKRLLICIILSAGFSACAHGPKVAVSISDPEKGGLQTTYANGTQGFIDYKDSGSFVCFSPDDWEKIMIYAKKNCH